MDLIQRKFQDFFRQKIIVTDVKKSRLDFFIDKLLDKSVIHYGCADWPIYNENSNLHLSLCKRINKIDGYDVDKDTIELMKKTGHFPEGSLFYELPNKKYDFILIPETIEHVDNVSSFLHSILKNAEKKTQILITAPNAFAPNNINAVIEHQDHFIEMIHPDHNCWYSIYTLPNVIEKSFNNIGKKVVFNEIGFIDNKSSVYSLFEVN